jgi:DNA repair protein RecO (recombination protein O)
MKKIKFTGVVINRQNHSEADRIITVYTQELGKIRLKAAGVRKITSRRAGTIELFNLVKGAAVVGRNQFYVLTEVELLHSFSEWKHQLGRINLGFQISEAVDSLTPEGEPFPEVFQLLTEYLNSISEFGRDWQAETSAFLLRLLVILGYWPEDKPFSGDIYGLIESVTNRRFNSSRLLQKISGLTNKTSD